MEDDLLLVWGDAPMEREEGEDEDEEKRVLGWGRRRRKTATIAMAAEYALLREVVVANTTQARWRRTACPVRVQRRERGEEMRGGGIQNGVSSHFQRLCVWCV